MKDWINNILLAWLLLLLFTTFGHSQAAFIGAQGAGAVTAGGRGGTICRVTNLNNSGAGSFRACAEGSGARIVVFDVGGTIDMLSELHIQNPNISIYGQTAPGGGILISGKNAGSLDGFIYVNTNNVVIQYLSVRLGSSASRPASTGTGIWIGNGTTNNVILDHLSVSWTTDDCIAIWRQTGVPDIHSVTTSWSIFSEPLAAQATVFSIGSSTSTDGMDNIDFHHNLAGWGTHRMPHHSNHLFRYVNNITYNYSFRGYQCDDGCELDVISNIWKAGPANDASVREMAVDPDLASNNASGIPSIYFTGNKGPHHSDPDTNGWPDMVWEVDGFNGPFLGTPLSDPTYRRLSPLAAQTFPITATHANSLETLLLAHVGNSRRLSCLGEWEMRRDAVDARLIGEYNEGTGIAAPSDETSVGGYPTISGGTACVDTDGGGVPDEYEDANGMNKASSADDQATQSGGPCDTYTKLDCFLAGLQLSADSKPITGKGRGIPK